MKKLTKMKALNRAIIRTTLTGLFYLAMPIFASVYDVYFPDAYIGYTIFGSGLLILGSMILLIWSWFLVFDRNILKQWNDEYLNNGEL